MKLRWLLLGPGVATLGCLTSSALAQKLVESKPATPSHEESLRYVVKWPGGFSHGQVNLTSHQSGAGWDLMMSVDAGIPGFQIADRFHSLTQPGFCSLEFVRETTHGTRKSNEKTTFDYPAKVAHRVSLIAGGTSDLGLSSNCAYDALAYLFVVRGELAKGLATAPAQIFFGAAYSIRLETAGQQTLTVGDKSEPADRVAVHVKGPASTSDFEIFFARDPMRTPLLAHIPTSIGAISLELSP